MCLDILFRREMISSDDKLAVEIDLVIYFYELLMVDNQAAFDIFFSLN